MIRALKTTSDPPLPFVAVRRRGRSRLAVAGSAPTCGEGLGVRVRAGCAPGCADRTPIRLDRRRHPRPRPLLAGGRGVCAELGRDRYGRRAGSRAPPGGVSVRGPPALGPPGIRRPAIGPPGIGPPDWSDRARDRRLTGAWRAHGHSCRVDRRAGVRRPPTHACSRRQLTHDLGVFFHRRLACGPDMVNGAFTLASAARQFLP
jgi:hypothetical protein